MLDIVIADLTSTRLWLVVLAVTAFGLIDKLVFYQAGKHGGSAALNKVHGFTPERADKFHSLYESWGAFLLLLAAVPVIGSVATVLSGVSGVALPIFIVLVVISNLVRNWLLIILSSGVVQLLP